MLTFKNARTQDRDNFPICPRCWRPIAHGDEAAADGDFILHLPCWKGPPGAVLCKACGKGIGKPEELATGDRGPYHRACAPAPPSE